MEAAGVEAMGAGGVVIAVVVALILWKVLKMTLKVVFFLVVAAVLAVGVGSYLKHGRVALPVDAPSADSVGDSVKDAARDALPLPKPGG